MERSSEHRLYLLVIVAFVAKHLLFPQTFRSAALSIATPLSYAIAQCIVTLQVIQFYIKRPHDRLPATLPGSGSHAKEKCPAPFRSAAREGTMRVLFLAGLAGGL